MRNRHGTERVPGADATPQPPLPHHGRNPLMAQLDTQVLPLLPLTTGVVLPGMVVTLTIESPDAAAAIDAAARGELMLVPRIEGRYARVGTVAKIEEVGKVRGGAEAA